MLLQLKLIMLKSTSLASNELVIMKEIRIIMVVDKVIKEAKVEVVMAEEIEVVMVEIDISVSFVVELVMWLSNAIIY